MQALRLHHHAIAALLIIAAPACCARAQSVDERFLDGLRQRRLFGLAEVYCAEKLNDSSLPEARRAELVVELSRAYTEHALNSTPAAADPLWKQAVEVTYDFARRLPSSPYGVLVKTQSALALQARGELARQQSEVLADNAQQLDDARGYFRLAARQLSEVSDELSQRLRKTGRPDENELPRDQLLSLERNVRYQLARTYRNQGQSYPANSPDRTNSLQQAAEMLGPLAQISAADPLSWQCRLEEIVCLRLLKDHAAAQRRLDVLGQQQPTPAVASRAIAEQIRLTLATGRLDAAVALVEAARRPDVTRSAELDLAVVEAYVAAWRAAEVQKNAADVKRRQAQASTMLGEVQRQHGPYWSRRAESLMTGQVATSTVPPSDLDLLTRTAESHYRNGQFEPAVSSYDRAAAFAEQQKDAARAFELLYAAASIEHEQKRHRAAADRFRRLSASLPKDPRAGEAHLLAIFNAAQEARRRDPPMLDEYAALIDEHLQLWPTGKTAEQAQWMLGRLREHESAWQAAIAAYQKVTPEHPQFAAAVEGVAACYGRWIDELKAKGEPTRDLSLSAARYFEGLFITVDGRLPERWSPGERLAATSAARVWLQATPPDFARAQQIVSAATADAGEAPAAWKSSAAGLLVWALAGQGEYAAARERLKASSAGSPAELLSLLEQLSTLVETSSPEVRKQVAALQLDAASLAAAQRNELDDRGRLSLDRIEAQALSASGNQAEALRRYAELAKQLPRDGQLQEEYATLLTASTDKATLEAALAKWRELEQRTKPTSPRWFRAKYHLALTYERLGNKTQAAKLITVTQVLHPDLGGPQLKAQFLELLARCKM